MILSQRCSEPNIQIEFYIRQICARIKTIREEKNISQENIGRALGISGQAYGKIEKGSSKITLLQLCIVAECLKTPLDRMLQIEPSDTIVIELEAEIEKLKAEMKAMDKSIDDKQLFIDLLQDKLKS